MSIAGARLRKAKPHRAFSDNFDSTSSCRWSMTHATWSYPIIFQDSIMSTHNWHIVWWASKHRILLLWSCRQKVSNFGLFPPWLELQPRRWAMAESDDDCCSADSCSCATHPTSVQWLSCSQRYSRWEVSTSLFFHWKNRGKLVTRSTSSQLSSVRIVWTDLLFSDSGR